MTNPDCYHCGTKCGSDPIVIEDKAFCCNGCKTVYEILNQHELNVYYDLESTPGTIPNEIAGKFDYLGNLEIAKKILEFDDEETAVVNFYIPSIHCSSCIWVLENLHKLNRGVKATLVNFPKKEVRITFKKNEISLQQVAELITSIGYEPYISLESADADEKGVDRKLIYQVAVAGFAFGNIMMLSFPEYFQMDEFWLNRFKPFFRGIMLAMAVPALIYSGRDYLISAYKGLKHGILNIDVPISLGILVLFLRSSYEVVTGTGQGYFDSLTGLIFFLLLGKIFQQKTYSFLSFERDYKSYFPIAVTQIHKDKSQHSISVNDIKKGDRLLIRNEEIIPVDGILLNGEALIDYSFVTGESLPLSKVSGDKLFAGGKQKGPAIEMEAIESVKQSYLTQLWSKDVFGKEKTDNIKTLTDSISKQFTLIILGIATAAGIYWYIQDRSIAFQVVSAILIVACPCALALSAPFSLGNMIRIFGKESFYLKDAYVIESLSRADTLLFDKTGTITANNASEIQYAGNPLTKSEMMGVKAVLKSSNHPLSRALFDHIPGKTEDEAEGFTEHLGRGISGTVKGVKFALGSAQFTGAEDPDPNQTQIHVRIDDTLKGRFLVSNNYRKGLKRVMEVLGKGYELSILTGDNEGEKENLEEILPEGSQIFFRQKPEDKLNRVKSFQETGKTVMMLGDGLNDAGALVQSDVGIAISENINVFSPACDGILDARSFSKLPSFLKLSEKTMSIIKMSFVISFLYNIIGLLFAITGNLSPIVAAILMPVSSISVVLFATLATNFVAKKILY
jgi:Cu+-exporting ATPase